MIDTIRLRIFIVALAGWVNRHQLEFIEYLREENRVLNEHLGGQRLHFTDPQRRRLAATSHRLGRQALTDVVTIVTPDTLLRWHRQLVARKWTTVRRWVGRPGVLREIRALTVRMARENPTWGYRRIQGALKNLGYRVARSTVAAILRAEGMGPVPERPMSWRTFLAAHWGAIAAADFFTTEVWTARGLVTYYTVVVIELASRRVQLGRADAASG
jgi:putative transposase